MAATRPTVRTVYLLVAAGLVTAGVLAVAVLPGCERQYAEGKRPGDLCPEIAGTDADGKPVKLSDYRGKVVLVNFWGTWCPPCRKMLPHEKEQVQGTYRGRMFAILGVAQDDPETLGGFLKHYPLPWKNIADGQPGALAKEWEVAAFPAAILVDHKGVIRRLWLDGITDPEDVWDAVERAVKTAEAE